jgi:phosphate transport system permease protein
VIDPSAQHALDLRARPSWRSAKNTIMSVVMVSGFVLIAIPLFAILYSLFSRGAHAAFSGFPDFFTKEIPHISRLPGPGMGPAILGTLLVTTGATLMAVPLGILGAVYLHEYGNDSKFSRLVRFMSVVMTGVPSIVMGLFVYVLWTMRFGYSAFGGSIAMACLMLPVVIGSTEQMLRLVPTNLREASYALGSTKSRTIVTVVIPAALPGIVSGSLLAVARAAGETAPLLFTIGAATQFNRHLFDGANNALSAQIFVNANSSFAGAQDRAWGAALTLVLLTFTITVIARVFTARFAMKR